jgi:uncharacterized membrane protein
MRHRTIILVSTLLLPSATSAVSGGDPFFTGLGFLPGDDASGAAAVSADGAFVVGQSGVWTCHGLACWLDDPIGFRYEIASGDMTALDSLFAPTDVSGDGAVVIGSLGSQATRWSADHGFTTLDLDEVHAVSADGDLVVGTGPGPWTWCDGDCAPTGYWPMLSFGWAENGGRFPLPVAPPETEGAARGVSADGSIVVGFAGHSGCDAFSGECVFVSWRAVLQDLTAGEAIDLGVLPGYGASEAFAVSDDGSTVIGICWQWWTTGSAAFRWTEATGMEELEGLADTPWSIAAAVSADGSVVVGVGYGPVPLIWDMEHGTRLLEEVLVSESGLDLTGWTLGMATGISGDGRTIVGSGTNPAGLPEGWIAHLGDVTIPGDINADGVVDVRDLLAVLAAWGPCADCKDCPADVHDDCDVNHLDLLIVLSNWS